jgi:hypothetical protein
MMSPQEKAAHAYEEGALRDLLMGKWPYYEPEAYMAPSNVPTNWRTILVGLNAAIDDVPDISQGVNEALRSMTGSAEEVYSAVQTILFYLRARKRFSPNFVLDCEQLLARLGSVARKLEYEARHAHPDWMGPTDETCGIGLRELRKFSRMSSASNYSSPERSILSPLTLLRRRPLDVTKLRLAKWE